jgi:murein DD-endopeptidase MepM/ murein hydrolase activator NlpD
MRWGRLHAGIDIPAPGGTPIYAAAGGRVTQAGVFGGYGNYSCIQHARALTTCYAHQSQLRVRTGQNVKAGQLIGAVGNTGASFGDHLHFEVRRGAGFSGTPVDPAPYLQGASGPGAGATTAAGAGAGCSPDTQLAALEGGSLLWPTTRRGQVIGRPYTGTHTLGNWQSDNAIDIAVAARTPIVAVASGRICSGCGFGGPAGTGSGRFDGARLTLDTASGNQVFYAHLKRVARGVRPGARVERGQVIAWSWMANGVPHLHIGVRDGNPLTLFGVDSAPTGRAA